LPDDIDDSEKFLQYLTKKELGLGKPLALDFARELLPTTSTTFGNFSAAGRLRQDSRFVAIEGLPRSMV